MFDSPAPVQSYQCQSQGILLYEHYINCVSEHKSLTVCYWQVLKGRHFNKTVNCFYYNIQLQWQLDYLCRPQKIYQVWLMKYYRFYCKIKAILSWKTIMLLCHVFFISRCRKYNWFFAILQLLWESIISTISSSGASRNCQSKTPYQHTWSNNKVPWLML
jgi:hypothetical protein